MNQRSFQIDSFIQESQWAEWTRRPIAGDASGRRYERLARGSKTVILMDADPAIGEAITPFSDMTTYLSRAGLSPPKILAQDANLGVMVLSYLGSDTFAQWLDHGPDEAMRLYNAACDILEHLTTLDPPEGLKTMTPEIGAGMIGIACTHYAGHDDTEQLTRSMQDALDQFAPRQQAVALRDFHAENLIWRPAMSGFDQVGLLDYQDAFIAPAGYDLVSLLRDARRDVPVNIVEALITRFSAKLDTEPDKFRAGFAVLGVQRNLRILGVFARLAVERGKPHYIDMIPRVWRHIQTDLAHPALGDLAQAVAQSIPAPDAEILQKLRG